MTPHLQPILSELRTRLEAHYGERLERLVLFGSHARGDAEADSDIDVLVVLNSNVNDGQEIIATSAIFAELSLAHNTLLSPVFVTAVSFKSERSPLLMNARKEGVPI